MANKIMKSTLASVLALMSVATCVPGTAIGNVIADTAITASAEAVSGDYTYEELSDGTVSITKYNGTESVVEIPVKINGKTVTKIGDKAFMGNEYVTEIYFSNYITSVGEFAFCNCTALKSVYCSNSVKTIGRGAFSNCTSLDEINNLGGLEAIEEGTFQRCTSLEVFHIPGRVKYIGTGAFQECTNLREVYFYGTTIGKKAFYKCENLSDIDMYEVVDIGDYAFFGCSSLSDLSELRDLETIGNSAFGSCSALTVLNLVPCEKLTSIGNDAFANCKNLKEVSLPENLTTLGKRAFANCHEMKVDIFSKKLTTIPMGAFASTGITGFTVPEGVTSIDDAAFNSCKSLSRVTLPSTLKTIGAKAFDNTGVNNVIYNGTERQWRDVEIGEGNDVLVNANKEFNIDKEYPHVYKELTYDSVKLSWTAVYGAEKYGIFEKINGEWVMHATCSDAPEKGDGFTIGNLEPGWHDFAVIAMIDGEWNWSEEDSSEHYNVAYVYVHQYSTYPKIETIAYNEPTHQFRFCWTQVKGAEKYGIAVKLAGKWKVQAYLDVNATSFTSPKLTAGSTHKVVIAAKVNGKWDTSNLSKRAFTVTVK
ncbi:MAG: leucine-rich repeat domain-containing protein [Ruminococcus sp.]|uniref:leucine-rich repeat domain-containing protein n=1 Tax=Ruminococcus sp. TaxID=41978 RepID=UPI0025EA0FC2|nr:leucine-rich repeat domain-containing protein [Ruminococcus sp.]MCR5540035.1 leucine-rich repeat domain-containing protein [Ruminococcus sp.]